MKFRKLPVEIEAVRWRGYSSNLGVTVEPADMPTEITEANMHNVRWERVPDWLPKPPPIHDAARPLRVGDVVRDGEDLLIGTLEGTHRCCPGDWVIRGIKGELYPCKPDIFALTYEIAP